MLKLKFLIYMYLLSSKYIVIQETLVLFQYLNFQIFVAPVKFIN